jgi:hypothetical protein
MVHSSAASKMSTTTNKSNKEADIGSDTNSNTNLPKYDVILVGAGFGSITTFYRYVVSCQAGALYPLERLCVD